MNLFTISLLVKNSTMFYVLVSEIECVFASKVVRDEKYIWDVYIALFILIIKVFWKNMKVFCFFLRDRFAGYNVVIHGDFNINLLLAERNNLCSKYISLL